MSFIQVSVEIDGSDLEQVTGVFEAAGAMSVTTLDAGDEPLLEPAPGETPVWKRARVTALFDPDRDTALLQDELERQFPGVAPGLAVEALDDRDWSSTWRDSFTSMRFGQRLWICPTGEVCPDPEAIVVRLDPGLAFGTGTHATTAMCLEWLGRHPPVDQRVIDYGCGSGILAIAAHKLGAAGVHAVDIDPQALLSTRVNAGRNGITANLTVQLPDAFSPGCVDLVIANILANPLVELAGTLSGYLNTGGRILMTGILAEQAENVMSAYRSVVDFSPPVAREEWVLLTGRKR